MEGSLLKTPSRARHFVLMATALASLASLLLGYDIGVMSGAILFIESHMSLSTMQVQIVVASLNLVSAIGAIIGGRAADSWGRKRSIAVSSLVFIIGAIWMAIADSFGVLLGGRLLTGLAVGAGLVIAPLYTAELAPAESRGRLVAMMVSE
jgi:MFS family permease